MKGKNFIDVGAMQVLFKGSVQGMEVPRDIYCILKAPALLGGMRYPHSQTDWTGIAQVGFKYVVNLEDDSFSNYDHSPLKGLYSAHLEDLCSGRPPRNEGEEKRLITEAVEVIVSTLCKGEGVLVHCIGGRGRTGTVMGCILKRLGYSSEAILKYLNDLHIARGKPGWPESEWQKALVCSFE